MCKIHTSLSLFLEYLSNIIMTKFQISDCDCVTCEINYTWWQYYSVLPADPVVSITPPPQCQLMENIIYIYGRKPRQY